MLSSGWLHYIFVTSVYGIDIDIRILSPYFTRSNQFT